MKTQIKAQLYQEIAKRHGVDFNQVAPRSREVRLQQLLCALQNRMVPYPVDPETADRYFQLAASGVPFGIGSLTDRTVELGEYINHQVYESLAFEDHLSWACLVADQQSTKHQYACREYLQGEELFEIGGARIPDYYLLNARIYQQTGWQLATVNKIIPANVFFHCHSRKFFPVTTFMRPLETDYLEEPDIGHDVAGHVATFTIPQVAQVMNSHGLANDLIHREKEIKLQSATTAAQRAAITAEADELLLYAGRLYWFTVEFGLVKQQGQLKVFGAGILSSPGETQHSIDSPLSNRILIDVTSDRDLLRLATTDYLISEYQKTYFVLDRFDSLNSLTPERILHIVHTARQLPHHTWTEVVPGDRVLHVGQVMTSSNEKYARWRAGWPLDPCQSRTLQRNLRMFAAGIQVENSLGEEFMRDLPAPPET
jgi:phenylalanine-4-hydroxylase